MAQLERKRDAVSDALLRFGDLYADVELQLRPAADVKSVGIEGSPAVKKLLRRRAGKTAQLPAQILQAADGPARGSRIQRLGDRRNRLRLRPFKPPAGLRQLRRREDTAEPRLKGDCFDRQIEPVRCSQRLEALGRRIAATGLQKPLSGLKSAVLCEGPQEIPAPIAHFTPGPPIRFKQRCF